MPNAVYIILGSNYNPYQENSVKFAQELTENGYSLTTFSVDTKSPPPIEGDETSSGLDTPTSLHRIQMELSDNNLNELIDKIALQVSSIDYLIIIDSIHFKWAQFGYQLREQLSDLHPHLNDSPVVHFIGPEYEHPIFNRQGISEFDFGDFKLTSPGLLNRLTPYLLDLEKLEKIDYQISKKNIYFQLRCFMRSPGFNSVFSDAKAAVKIIFEEITKHICGQIDLDKIGHQLRLQVAIGA